MGSGLIPHTTKGVGLAFGIPRSFYGACSCPAIRGVSHLSECRLGRVCFAVKIRMIIPRMIRLKIPRDLLSSSREIRKIAILLILA
jgi:hypothetical protein